MRQDRPVAKINGQGTTVASFDQQEPEQTESDSEKKASDPEEFAMNLFESRLKIAFIRKKSLSCEKNGTSEHIRAWLLRQGPEPGIIALSEVIIWSWHILAVVRQWRFCFPVSVHICDCPDI